MHTLARRLAAAMLAAAGASSAAVADSFPSKPVKLIVPFAAGGGTDILARLVAQKVSAGWGQQIVIENRGGAGGRVATEMTARAAPDGYTLLVVSAAHAINASMYKDLPYHPVNSFTPIGLWTTAAYVLVVNAKSSDTSVADLVAHAKREPGKLTFSSSGNASAPHLSGELFKMLGGVDIVHVPYNGGGPGIMALVSGETAMSFSSIAPAKPLIQGGQLRAIGVTTAVPTPSLPGVPPIASGIPGYELTTWYGVLGPAGMDKGLAESIEKAMTAALKSPEIAAKLTEDGFDPDARSGPAFQKLIAEDVEKYARVIRASGAKAE